MISVTRKVALVRRPDKSRAIVADPDIADAVSTGRVPRISRLMALAIHFNRLIREGVVRDQSELAQLAHVTQPRITQIMNLNLLAPDIQEELLLLQPVTRGRNVFNERLLRTVVAEPDWSTQRCSWQRICRVAATGLPGMLIR